METAKPVPQPTPGELECLAVLWHAGAEVGAPGAWKLADIHRRLNDGRTAVGEAPLALTTVSTYLRSATAKGLLAEVRLRPTGDFVDRDSSRGALPGTRSPLTGYRVAYDPGEVFEQTYRAIVHAYPADKRRQALLDFARVFDLPPATVQQLAALLQADPGAAMPLASRKGATEPCE